MCPGAGMWYGCARRADRVTQSGKDYADLEGLVYKMAFNYSMAAHLDHLKRQKATTVLSSSSGQMMINWWMTKAVNVMQGCTGG